jgi:hypothetical protein
MWPVDPYAPSSNPSLAFHLAKSSASRPLPVGQGLLWSQAVPAEGARSLLGKGARFSATAYTGASATVNAWTLSITRHTVPRPCLELERPESHDAADSCVHDVPRHHSGGDGGIRTLTGGGLSALPLPVGLRPRGHLAEEAGVVDGHLCAVRIQTLGASPDVRRCGRRAGTPGLQARNRTRRQPAAGDGVPLGAWTSGSPCSRRPGTTSARNWPDVS